MADTANGEVIFAVSCHRLSILCRKGILVVQPDLCYSCTINNNLFQESEMIDLAGQIKRLTDYASCAG